MINEGWVSEEEEVQEEKCKKTTDIHFLRNTVTNN